MTAIDYVCGQCGEKTEHQVVTALPNGAALVRCEICERTEIIRTGGGD